MSSPDILTASYIAERWPRLFHMAEAGSWPSIRSHGLLSTVALLDRFEITGHARKQIESSRRPASVKLEHPQHGIAWIRDNKPINVTVLRRTLVGMSEAEWYRTLNSRVFFWLTEKRLDKLRRAPPYRAREHDILTLDTKALLAAHGGNVELAHLNTGAVHGAATYTRGAGTFRPIETYPWTERVRIAPTEPIVELTIPYSLPDAADFVVDVQTR
ncbi:MAG: DUF7002 family protein [Solirubrobacterales bacterium]